MPTLNFILPHWMYWGGLLVFPLVAMYLVSRQRRNGPPREPTFFVAYLFWLTAGYTGIHRFYLKSWLGLVYVPLFVAVVYCNGEVRDVRDDVSRTFAAREQAETTVRQAAPIDASNPTEDEKRSMTQARAQLANAKSEFDAAAAVSSRWDNIATGFGMAILVLLAIDAFLIPGMVRKRRAMGDGPIGVDAPMPPEVQQGTGEDPAMAVHTPFTDVVEWVNTKAGEFVAYWAVISVFVYYYEVFARFLFNSPTNWVHESMFLMYGMQYMISGAYAYKEDQHVRVDVVYSHLSRRGKAIADIVSSVFFFIFAITMLVTGWKFAWDAVSNHETSFTEWGIQYWPVKLCIPIGAALIALQGVCKLLKDIAIVRGRA